MIYRSYHVIKYDGNLFAEKALKNGAKYALVDRPEIAEKNHQFILVKNTLETLQELAKFHRKTLKAKIIALTGSNGKTTTTMLTHHVLKEGELNVGVAGNMGDSFAKQVAEQSYDEYVLELSSFQLDGIGAALHGHICRT